MTPEQIAEVLVRTSLFSGLHPADLHSVACACDARTYRKGQIVVTEGDPGDSMFVAASGLLTVSTETPGGDRFVLVTLRPPDVFGEIALLDGGPRSASVEATETSALVILRRDTLLSLVAGRPEIADALFRYLGGLVRRLTEQATDLALLDLHARVAKLLAGLARERGTPSGEAVVLDLPLTQSNLAAMVGGSRQSVNRVLRAFERRGWIALRPRTIAVLRPDALRRRGGG